MLGTNMGTNVEGHMQRRPKRASVNDARFAAVIAVLRQNPGADEAPLFSLELLGFEPSGLSEILILAIIRTIIVTQDWKIINKTR